jgi:hypothetical protein
MADAVTRRPAVQLGLVRSSAVPLGRAGHEAPRPPAATVR